VPRTQYKISLSWGWGWEDTDWLSELSANQR